MGDTKAIRIAGVKYTSEYVLRLRWLSGKTMAVDLREPVHRLKGMRLLRIRRSSLAPPRAKMGIASCGPVRLIWARIDCGKWRLSKTGHLDAVEFIRWRWRYGLNLSDAAEALGLSRCQVAYYASGERPVPRTVLLACKGWEAERQDAAA